MLASLPMFWRTYNLINEQIIQITLFFFIRTSKFCVETACYLLFGFLTSIVFNLLLICYQKYFYASSLKKLCKIFVRTCTAGWEPQLWKHEAKCTLL